MAALTQRYNKKTLMKIYINQIFDNTGRTTVQNIKFLDTTRTEEQKGYGYTF